MHKRALQLLLDHARGDTKSLGDLQMRRFVDPGREQDGALALRQLVQRAAQRFDLEPAFDDLCGRGRMIGAVAQQLDFGWRQPPTVGLASVRGDVERHTQQIGLWTLQRRSDIETSEAQIRIMQDLARKGLGAKSVFQTRLEIVVAIDQQPLQEGRHRPGHHITAATCDRPASNRQIGPNRVAREPR